MASCADSGARPSWKRMPRDGHASTGSPMRSASSKPSRQLRCKEIWVVGANRYRNPDEDLPADFEAQRTPYYQALKLPLDADRFIADLQARCVRRCRPSIPACRESVCPDRAGSGERMLDHGDAVRSPARAAEPDRAQGRNHRDLADDEPARHGQGGRPAAGFHRGAEKPDGLRDSGPRDPPASAAACVSTASAPIPDFSAWPASGQARPPKIWPMCGGGTSR